MTTPIPPSLERFGEDLNRAAYRELSASSGPVGADVHRLRPRLLARGTLGLAGAGAAVLLAVSAAGTAPAFAITKNGDGSVTVQINEDAALSAANQKLTAMGIHEQVMIDIATGPAAVSGAVNCTPAPGASLPGPTLKVLVGKNGTDVISPGETAGNTGEGTYHLAHCTVVPDSNTGTGTGDTGNTGAG
jgi:hypothetical protein